MKQSDSEEIEKEESSEEDVKKLAQYYLDQVSVAKQQHGKFYKRGAKAIKEFLGERDSEDDLESRMNIYNSIVNTQLPAYYARTPKSEVSVREKQGDPLDVVGALAIENGTQYCLEECQDFDGVALKSIQSFLTVGRGVLWERYHAEFEQVEEEIPVIVSEGGGFLYPDGEPLEEGLQPEWDGERYVVNVTYDALTEEKSITEFVHYKDYLQGPARFESEIDWKARRQYFSKKEYEEEFKDDNPYFVPVSELEFNTYPEELKDMQMSQERKAAQGKLAVWQVWSKSRKKVLYLVEDHDDGPIAFKDPPVKLKGFFPCAPCLVANIEQDTLIPTCDHHIIKDLLDEVESLTTRLSHSIEAIKCSALADKKLADALDKMMSEDFSFIPIEDFQSFIANGSLADRVLWAPIEHLITAVQSLGQARNEALAKIYEVTGNSDLIRGHSDPRETAAAQQLKGNFANLRFSKRQREIQKFLAAQHKIKAEFMCSLFDEETLYQICKGKELEAQLPPQVNPITGEEIPASFIDSVVPYLRNPHKLYFIDIETDSMVAMDEEAEREQTTNYLNSIGQFISQTLPAIQQYPTMGELFIEMVDVANGVYRPGKKLENLQDEFLPKFLEEVRAEKAKSDQQQQDPGQMEAQIKLQVAQIEAQSDQQRVQMEASKAQMDAQVKSAELQLKQLQAEIEREKLALEREKIRLEYAKLGKEQMSDDMDLQSQAVKTAATIQKEEMDTEQAAIKAAADIQKVQQQPRGQ